MKKTFYILFILLFIFSCDSNPAGPSLDDCGVPGGDNSTCTDECGVVNGNNYVDDTCGSCSVNLWNVCYDIETTISLDLNGLLTGEIPAGCTDTDNGATDAWGYNCAGYTGYTSDCGLYDDDDFDAMSMCCVCNAGPVGEIPPEIGNLTNLRALSLSNNQLTGEIPSSIGNLTNLEILSLGNNELIGSIPSEIGNLTNLYTLSLRYNQLTGEIPSEIGNLTNLRWLYLNSNQLTGAIPSEIGNLIILEYLFLLGNQLTGEIPFEICNQGDSSPSLTSNYFCPPYPECVQDYIGTQYTINCP